MINVCFHNPNRVEILPLDNSVTRKRTHRLAFILAGEHEETLDTVTIFTSLPELRTLHAKLGAYLAGGPNE